jgi:UDP-N-acetylglucosamine 2-epimerase (non-hydrolysing)
MIDTLIKFLEDLNPPKIWFSEGLEAGNYLVLILHRPSNVDNSEKLKNLLNIISESAMDVKIIFPTHPRIENFVNSLVNFENLLFIEPQQYLEVDYLVKNSKGVITDSGGISEETTFMGIPCVTLGENTERPETITVSTNELVGSDEAKIISSIKKMIKGKWKNCSIPNLWDGNAGKRIVEVLERILSDAR